MNAWWWPGLQAMLVLFVILGLVMGLIWFERRLLAALQDRYGPNRVGPFGLLQPVADAIKLLLKEDWIPPFADKAVFVLAPMILVATVLLAFAVVPFTARVRVSDLNVGLLFFLGMTSLGVYSIVLAGWSSNSKYSLIGGLRAAAQMISYEIPMGLSLVGVVLLSGSFRLGDIVAAQHSLWFAVTQPVGLIVFLIAAVAEARRIPFDLPEADAEIIGGYHTEYSSMKFGMFFLGEYLDVLLISCLTAVFFLGGWLGPGLPPILWFALKTGAVVVFFICIRSVLPRFRFDQLMHFGWKVLLPVSLLNLLVTGAIALGVR